MSSPRGGPGRAAAFTLLLVAAAVPRAHAEWPLTSCTPLGQNLFVRDVLMNLYLWPDELRGANPGHYASPEAYLEAARYRPLDNTFSFITSRAASDAFFSASQFVGVGLSTAIAGGALRVLEVYPESPAAEAGLSRGDRIVAINGSDVSELIASRRVDAALGPAAEGAFVELEFASRDGTRRGAARLVKRPVTIPTVSLTQIHAAGGRRVGYLFFRNFVEPSHAALDAAFAALRGGVDDLVLDLRYNGGGLVSVAQHLASLIGGARTRGQLFAEYVHNDRNTFRNQALRFDARENALALDRLIVITTGASASASELVINGLRPFMPVVIVGTRTYGKPVGQYQIPFCDRVLAPVSFAMRNADGEGSYFDGLAPDCAAPDDLDHALGDSREASLREALMFAATGACTPPAQTGARLARAAGPAPRRAAGWQALLNAW